MSSSWCSIVVFWGRTLHSYSETSVLHGVITEALKTITYYRRLAGCLLATFALRFLTIFSLLYLFWKNKSRFMRSPCCLCIPLIVARQRLGKHFPVATNTHATTEESLDTSFSMRTVSYQRKVDDQFSPTQKVEPLLPSKRRANFRTYKWSWNKQKI
jgi:hypothetical protein